MILPTFTDILQARHTIAPHLHSTPLYSYQGLSDQVGTEVWVKHENHLPIRAFKVRGGVNFMAQIDPRTKARGVITPSTGNHGQSVAYAGRLFNVRVTVAMPNGANTSKAQAIQNLGAEVKFIGKDFDDCRAHLETINEREGMHYLSSGNEPLLIAGVGTCTLEIFETLPDVDIIIVPIGGGSAAAGACLVAKAINPSVKVIGVQAQAAPSAYFSWKENEPVEAKMGTFAEGLATRTSFEMPQAILQSYLDDFILVTESELKSAMILAIEQTHNLVEGAGAAALAGAIKIHRRLRGKKVVVLLSGGNITLSQLKVLLNSDTGA